MTHTPSLPHEKQADERKNRERKREKRRKDIQNVNSKEIGKRQVTLACIAALVLFQYNLRSVTWIYSKKKDLLLGKRCTRRRSRRSLLKLIFR